MHITQEHYGVPDAWNDSWTIVKRDGYVTGREINTETTKRIINNFTTPGVYLTVAKIIFGLESTFFTEADCIVQQVNCFYG